MTARDQMRGLLVVGGLVVLSYFVATPKGLPQDPNMHYSPEAAACVRLPNDPAGPGIRLLAVAACLGRVSDPEDALRAVNWMEPLGNFEVVRERVMSAPSVQERRRFVECFAITRKLPLWWGARCA